MTQATWKDVLEWDQGQVDEVRQLGYAYIKQGHYELALSLFEGLIGLEQIALADAHLLGALYLEMGNYTEATRWLNRALEYEPSHLLTLLNKAKALLVAGHLDEGLALARTLSTGEETEIANTAEALLLAYDAPTQQPLSA